MQILNEILDQSKLEAGKLQLSPSDFHLTSFVEETVALFGPKIVSNGLTLDIQMDETLPEGIHADRMRIGQVLSNLLSNALKFTETGRISVRVERGPRDSDVSMLRFTVSDSGIGLSNEAKDKLFTAFTQADNTTSRTYGGTGLGLSISKQLVELMGGEIGVESTVGVGSAFWFTVLCGATEGEVARPDRRRLRDQWRASRLLKVLVAEDNLTNQVMISAIFGKLGHAVTIAEDGAKALALVETNDFDLVLMDIRMPVMDGLEATRAIRSMGTQKATLPIIALTADIAAGNIEEYMQAGMGAVCAKPVDLSELLPAIDKCLGEDIHSCHSIAPPDITPRRRPGEAGDGPAPAETDAAPSARNGGAGGGAGGGEDRDVAKAEIDAEGAPDDEVAEAAIIDVDTLAAFADLVGWDKIAHLCETLTVDFKARGEVMTAAAQAGDIESLRDQVHALKGAFGQLGAKQAQKTAHRIDARCKAGENETAFQLVPELLQNGDEAIARLRQYVAARAPALGQSA